MLVGILSAILSSVDSALNSASTLLTLDFIEPAMNRKLEPRESRRIGTFATLGFMVVAAIWAPSIQGFPGLFSYIQSMFAYIVTPIVAIFLVGFFWDRANAQGAFTTLTCSGARYRCHHVYFSASRHHPDSLFVCCQRAIHRVVFHFHHGERQPWAGT